MSTRKKGLGKGFDVLVPVGVDVAGVTAQPHERVHKLAIDIVRPKANQPRKYFDEAALEQLTQSIREQGILQPLVVVQVEPNLYSIIAGERRWRAAKNAGLTEVPALVRSATEHQQLELALLENVQREDLSPLETAQTIARLHEQFNQSYEDIALRLGKAYTTVVNIVRLLLLPEQMQLALGQNKISEGHARALLSLTKLPKDQQVLFEQIIKRGWNVRQAESYAAAAKKAHVPTSKPSKQANTPLKTEKLAKQLEKYLGAPTKLQHTAKGGKLVISFTDEADLQRILSKIDQQG